MVELTFLEPYSGMKTDSIIEYIRLNKRLVQIASIPDEIYTIIQSCWIEHASQRPSMAILIGSLKRAVESSATLNASSAITTAANAPEIMTTTMKTVSEYIPQSPKSDTEGLSISMPRLRDVEMEEMIGKGNRGAVFQGKWNGIKVALKKAHDPQSILILKEAKIMCSLHHPNILSFFGLYTSPSLELCVVTEFMNLGTLISFKDKLQSLSIGTKIGLYAATFYVKIFISF